MWTQPCLPLILIVSSFKESFALYKVKVSQNMLLGSNDMSGSVYIVPSVECTCIYHSSKQKKLYQILSENVSGIYE